MVKNSLIFENISGVKELNNIVTQLGTFGNDVDKITDAVKGLSDEQMKLVFSASNLDESIANQIITIRANKAATAGATAAQTAQIGVVDALKAKYVSLAAVIKAHPVIAGITAAVAAIGIITAIIDKNTLSVKEAREQLDKLNSEIDEIHNTFSSTEKTVSGISKRFAELSQGVDQVSGKNLTLNAEDYKEFLDLSNQLADLFPTLSRNYDENGNAIVQLSGDVDTIVGSLTNLINAQRQLSNQEIAEKLPDTYKATRKSTQSYADEIEVLENQRDLYKRVLEDLHNLSSWEDIEDSQGKVKPEYYFLREKISHDGKNNLINNGSVQDAVRYYEQQLASANTSLVTTTNKYKQEWSKLNQSLFAWLYTDANYSVLSDDLQAGIQSVINTIDWNDFNYKDVDGVKNHILENIIEPIRDNQEVHDLFVQLFELQPGDLDRVDIARQLQNILNDLDIEFNVMPVVANENEVRTRLSNSIAEISGTARTTNTGEYMMSQLEVGKMEEYTKDFTAAQVELWLKATDGATSAQEAIEAYEKEIASLPKVDEKFAISPEDAEALSEYQSKIDSISDSLANKYNLTAGDITSLMTDFSEYANIWEQFGVNEYGEGDIESALEAIAQKLKEETANKIPQMRSYIEGMYEAVLNPKGNTDKLQLEVDSLELVLKDVRDGKVYDASATAKLINQYPELADAVKVLSEGYSFEEDAIIDLTNAKITSANEAIAWEIEQTEQAIKATRARIAARNLELNIRKKQGAQMALLDENGEVQYANLDLKTALKDNKELQELIKKLEELEALYAGNIDELIKNAGTELFDWYETRISRIEDRITDFGNTVSDVYSAWGVREEALQGQIAETGNLYEAQMAAREAYLEKANAVGLDQSYVDKIKQGQYSFDELNEKKDVDLIADIQEYIEWYEKAIDMENAAADSQRTLNELRTQGFEQIQTQYDAVLSDFENQASLIEAGLANAEARGQLAVQGFYQQLYANEEMNRAALVAERIALEEALNKLGVTGGEEFDRLQDEIDGVTIAIAESENALLEFENAIRDADWGIFDFNREQAQRVMGESDFLLDLLDAKKLVDEMGEFTDNGLASIGLHGVNYNGYLEESIRYTEELANLEEDIRNNPDDTNYINRYNEILEKKQEMITASESEKEAIADLVRESYEAQKNALQELIDNYTEALDAEKNLYDQQKKTAQQTKKIADLRKMIASAAGDGSEETRSQVQKWQVELDDAQSQLESDQYDQYISDQKDILSSIFEDYSEVLDEKAEDTERLFQEAMAQAKTNTSAMKNTVETAAGAVGYDIDTGVDDLLSDSSSLNLNLNQVEARLLSNGTSITDGVAQIDGTNQIISGNITSLVNNTTGLNEWIGQVKDAISGENGISGKLDDIKSKVAEIAGKDFNVNVDNDNNTPDIKPDGKPQGSGNTEPKVGDKIQSLSGSWYESSDGTGNIGTVDKKDPDYWILDKINKGSKYPYHVIGLKNNGAFAGSGWVKNFPEYATGLQKANKDHLAWTQDGGDEIIIRPSDGAVLTPITKGSTVLDATATQNLRNMANDPAKFIRDNLTFSIPDIDMAGRGNIENNIAISIPLENVTDVQSFLVEFQRNPKIQAVIKDMIAESTLGTSSLAKYRHKMK